MIAFFFWGGGGWGGIDVISELSLVLRWMYIEGRKVYGYPLWTRVHFTRVLHVHVPYVCVRLD